MLPYTTDPYRGKDAAKSEELRAFVARHGFPHTAGCLFSGAGGGFLMVVSEASVEGAMKMRINTDPVVLPYGSSTIEEARSAPKAGPPPSKPPWGVATPWHLDVDGRPFPDKAPDASQFATQMWRSASFACSRVVAHARSCLLFDSCVEACNSDARVATVAAVAVASVVGVA